MLGNFSFGDYFKKEAIEYAWEFITKELKLDKERLWVSVYRDDDEAYAIWRDKIGIPAQRICKFGAKDNFWPANAPEVGPDGPCGPCSEIFFDQGKQVGCKSPECNPSCGCGRFVEFWNLVFTQFNRRGENNLFPLANKNIDTGMGLERMAAVLQGVTTNFEIDIFKPITAEIIHLSPLKKTLTAPQYNARNAIADHIRAVTFAIADGVVPSNDERGYVVRKLIRRAVWHGRGLNIEKPYLYKLVPAVVKVMCLAYPELEKKREEIAQVVLAEERRFQTTLEKAMQYADQVLTALKSRGEKRLPGEEAFKLYDTYGLPLEMLEILLISRGFEFDEPGFNLELESQRKSSRKTSGIDTAVFVDTLVSKHELKATTFVGEAHPAASAKIVMLFKDERPVEKAEVGDVIKFVLEPAPFYGESGGQVGDSGVIKNAHAQIEVLDTKKIEQTLISSGKVAQGFIQVGDTVEATIDWERRKNIARNHTATHLLQWALRSVLGDHVRQSGSWVGPERLRFDFTHFQGLNERELERVEQLVNEAIKKDQRLNIAQMEYKQAQQQGTLAFFGEKYQERVRVVAIGDISRELCGGTHVVSTGDIELFKILSESSVASGIRRIEAVTGASAAQLQANEKDELRQFESTFGASSDKLEQRIEGLLRTVKELEKRLQQSRVEDFKVRVDQIIKAAGRFADTSVIVLKVAPVEMPLLRLMSDIVRQKAKPAVIVLGSVWEEKAQIICVVTADIAQKVDAARIIRAISSEVDGSGGGRADFAQAGGRNIQGLDQALAKAEELIKKELQ